MIDGKLSQAYEDVLKVSGAGFRWVDSHTFRFYGIKGGQVYRITIDLG
jgi:hypothetical protein